MTFCVEELQVNQPDQVAPDTADARMECAVIGALTACGVVQQCEIVTHVEVVALVRSIDDTGHDRFDRRTWCPPGADPHMRYGVLAAAAKRLKRFLI